MAVKTIAQEIIDNIKIVKSLSESNEVDSEEIAKELDWEVSRARLYKKKLIRLSSKELDVLKKQNCKINEKILGAICLAPPNNRVDLISKICPIQSEPLPFMAIDDVLSELEEEHPLEKLSDKYWLKVGDYLKDRSISHYAFHDRAINFVKSIGYNGGFSSQSEKQKSWIIDLIRYDKNDVGATDIFANKELLKNELEEDYKIINEFIKCL